MARKLAGTVQLKVRLPRELHSRIANAAADNRSMNSEIVARLARSFQKEDDATTAVAKALIAGLDDGIVTTMFEILDLERREELYADAVGEALREEELHEAHERQRDDK